jgi:anti-anti-sigma regulatory factor
MDYEKTTDQLTVRLMRDFNLFTARRVGHLVGDIPRVRLDLSHAKFVDSEAVRLLYDMVTSGKAVTLVRPPEILREVIDVLGLDGVLDLDAMTETGSLGKESE